MRRHGEYGRTHGVLPFVITLEREIPGAFAAALTIPYTTAELGIAAVPPGAAKEAALEVGLFEPGTCAVGGASCAEDGDCGANGPCVGATYSLLPTTVNTVNHEVTATGVTSTGSYVVLHPDVLGAGYRPPLIAGGAGQISDCRGEWQVVNALNAPFFDRKGRVNPIQICHDGDVTCDADRTVNDRCIFRVGVCFNFPDPVLPTCTVGDDTISGYLLSRPRPTSRKIVDATNAQQLLTALAGIGGAISPLGVGIVDYTPEFSDGRCTDLVDFRVDIVTTRRKPIGRQNVRGMARFGSGALDGGGDRLKLRCYPAL